MSYQPGLQGQELLIVRSDLKFVDKQFKHCRLDGPVQLLHV
jgi:hypothetical protein